VSLEARSSVEYLDECVLIGQTPNGGLLEVAPRPIVRMFEIDKAPLVLDAAHRFFRPEPAWDGLVQKEADQLTLRCHDLLTNLHVLKLRAAGGAVEAEGVLGVAVVGRVLRGREEGAVQPEAVGLVVQLVLVPLSLGDLDQNVELHGASSLLSASRRPPRLRCPGQGRPRRARASSPDRTREPVVGRV